MGPQEIVKIPEGEDFSEVFEELKDKITGSEKIRLMACAPVKEGKGKNFTILTSHRLIMIRRGEFLMVGESEMFKDFPYRAIEEINVEERKGYDLIVINLETGKKKKFMIPEGSGPEITSFIRRLESEKRREEKGEETPTQKLERLSDLKDKKAITEEEFEKKKEEILEDI
ncbi:MAG: SHOCT domain-containing protein [Candidatus Aenigmatarchaeota archaeon]